LIYNNHYLNKLYNDLVTNSPKTISMNIPSDIGQGKIVQTKIKHCKLNSRRGSIKTRS